MNCLYLEVGGVSYDKFCQMGYWDYLVLCKSIRRRNAERSGKQYATSGVPEHSKDMIDNLKEIDRK